MRFCFAFNHRLLRKRPSKHVDVENLFARGSAYLHMNAPGAVLGYNPQPQENYCEGTGMVAVSMSKNEDRLIEIVLSSRRPLKIHGDQWPVIAVITGDSYRDQDCSRHDQQLHEGQLDEYFLEVRQHRDDRVIVRGIFDAGVFSACEDYKGGVLLEAGADIPGAIQGVGKECGIPDRFIRRCIEGLPAEDLDETVPNRTRIAPAKTRGGTGRAALPATFETAFGTYEATDVLGEGGSGRVYGVVRSDGAQFALKALRPELSSSDRRKRFKNEIDFLSKMHHPNIIGVIDYGLWKTAEGTAPFYVMPRIQQTLRAAMTAGLHPEQVLLLFTQMLDGLEVAHGRRVSHRDLKPENVLYEITETRLLIADFGVAHFEEEDLLTAVESRQADRLANFVYAAPEQRRRHEEVGHRADIYALGLILNEMFTREVPQGAGYRTIGAVAPAFACLDPLVDRMIQQAPDARPGSIDEIRRALPKLRR
jgi:hypothetical protein